MIVNIHVSAVPAAAVLVGLITVGTWVEQLELVAALQPRKIVTAVDAAIEVEESSVNVTVGDVPEEGLLAARVRCEVMSVDPENALKELKLFNWKVVAEGEAALLASPDARTGKVIVILPEVGTAATVVKAIVCIAVIGTTTGSPLWCAFVTVLVK